MPRDFAGRVARILQKLARDAGHEPAAYSTLRRLVERIDCYEDETRQAFAARIWRDHRTLVLAQ